MAKGINDNRKGIKSVYVRIPDWLGSIESITEKTHLKPARALAILHQFFLAWLKNESITKNKKLNLLSGYFAVSSEILKEVGTKDYNRYIELFIAEKIIERKSNGNGGRCYAPGGHAQLYRWIIPSDRLCKPKFRKEKIVDCTTVKSILRTRDNHQRIDFRITEARELLPVFETLKSFVLDTIIADTNNEGTDIFDELNWFVVDDFGGRFHHRISSMPKELRSKLRFKSYENTPLATIDFRNSQFFFSAVLNKALIESLLPEFKPIITIAEGLNTKPDFLLYRQLCVEGRLYEFFLQARGVDTYDKLERDKIKEQLFRAVLFSRKRVYGSDKQFQNLFKTSFPSVFLFFSKIKRMNEFDLPELKSIIKPEGKVFKYRHSNDSYKLLPSMMQRAESRMMYQVISPKLIEAGIRPITIHDSVMFLPEHVEQAQGIIKESFENLGLPAPSLSVDFC